MISMSGATVHSRGYEQKSIRLNAIMSTAAIAIAASLPVSALAQTAQTAQGEEASSVEEIVVTGSRIIREGYEAPTPLSVVSAETLENSATANVVTALATMPAITGAATASVSAGMLGQGNPGLQALNLRSLGSNRVLVLLDGQRTVASHYSNAVDVANFPSQLIQRVDVVTGGASAVYGSDAVAGVVNFILDKEFKGVRAELSGGLTNYGDDKNYKVNLSAGFGFAGDRGHVLLSGEHMHTNGISGVGGRTEQLTGWQNMTNPAYTPTNGQPFQLSLPNSSPSTQTAGGIIVAGPLKGTAFGAGGTPYQFQYGSIVAGIFMSGGDWKGTDIRPYYDMAPGQTNDGLFTRVSYTFGERVTAYAQWGWSQNRNNQQYFPAFFPGTATGQVIQIDNPFIPASTRAAMTANNITSFPIGSWNLDLEPVRGWTERLTNRISVGLDGTFDAFDSTWSWNVQYGLGSTKTSQYSTVPVGARYRLAIDAVLNPSGQIVCRSVLLGANNGCKPWNAMGIGVNEGNGAAKVWIRDEIAFQYGMIDLETYSASVSGEPFSVWAGPVSLALSAEHRTDEIHAVADAASLPGTRIAGNYAPLDGKQSVTEGAAEVVFPLAAKEQWAQAWDINAAVRATDYELAGYVTTWKVGTTYTLNDSIRFRVTRSRDIRAPNLQDLFAAPSFGTSTGLIDHFLGGVVSATAQQAVGGNVNLRPEKADTTGIGVVLTPSFLEGFAMSADYWDVNVKDAIQALSAQQVVNSCFTGQLPELCNNITRNPEGTIRRVDIFPVNLTVLNVRGIDLEASYRTDLADMISGWSGDFSLHGLMTFYLRNFQDTTFAPPTDTAGQNGGVTPPHWKLNVTASYSLDPITASVTGRAVSAGKINNAAIECQSGCPTSTADRPTVNYNSLPGAFYLDANASYKLMLGEDAEADLFISARNLLNKKIPPIPATYFYPYGQTGSVYDAFGVIYRAGIRFRM